MRQTLQVAPIARSAEIPVQTSADACRSLVIGAKDLFAHSARGLAMVIHSNSLVVEPARTSPITSPPEQERERLRRELLRRIIERETRRRALRGWPH